VANGIACLCQNSNIQTKDISEFSALTYTTSSASAPGLPLQPWKHISKVIQKNYITKTLNYTILIQYIYYLHSHQI